VGTFEQLGISLGLGLLVGLQRERTESHLAGIRTFPLVTVLGTFCALPGTSVVAAGLLCVTALVAVGHASRVRTGESGPGLTTEAALLLMYAVGAYLMLGAAAPAVAASGVAEVRSQDKSSGNVLARGQRPSPAPLPRVPLDGAAEAHGRRPLRPRVHRVPGHGHVRDERPGPPPA